MLHSFQNKFKSFAAAAVVSLFALAGPALAVPIHFSIAVESDTSVDLLKALVPVGTVVTADITLDVGPGKYNTSAMTVLGGAVLWINGGAQVFTPATAQWGSAAADGEYLITLEGPDVTIGGSILERVFLVFNLGVNPFTDTMDLSDRLLSTAKLNGLAVNVKSADASFALGGLVSSKPAVSASVSALPPVPLPGSVLLLSTALAGFALTACKTEERRA